MEVDQVIRENQMERSMEHEMETGIIGIIVIGVSCMDHHGDPLPIH